MGAGQTSPSQAWKQRHQAPSQQAVETPGHRSRRWWRRKTKPDFAWFLRRPRHGRRNKSSPEHSLLPAQCVCRSSACRMAAETSRWALVIVLSEGRRKGLLTAPCMDLISAIRRISALQAINGDYDRRSPAFQMCEHRSKSENVCI